MKKSSCGFGEENCFMFVIVNLWELMTLRVGAFMTLGAWLAGFIKRITTHCYTQIMRALRLVVSEKKMLWVLLCFPMTPPGRGLSGPQGHGWKDLQREPSYVATNKKESSGPCGFGEEDFFMFIIFS